MKKIVDIEICSMIVIFFLLTKSLTRKSPVNLSQVNYAWLNSEFNRKGFKVRETIRVINLI